MTNEFHHLGFSKHIFVKGRRSIADQFAKARRCGIYILHFSNGEYYVGQAVNVASRYAQHRVKHMDIDYISFKYVGKKRLSQAEKDVIKYLEGQEKALRNISLVSIIKSESDLDEVVSLEDQEKWLNDELPWETLETERFEYPEQRKKYTLRFNQLKKHKGYDIVCQALQEYILFTTPFPRKTEYAFWSLTCLPEKNILARVNIFWQETLRLFEYPFEYEDQGLIKKGMAIAVFVFATKSVLFKDRTPEHFKDKFKSLSFEDLQYSTGGADQQCISCFDYEFIDILYDPDIYLAIKTFNLRLMRKGATIFSRYHCFDLADKALRTDVRDHFV